MSAAGSVTAAWRTTACAVPKGGGNDLFNLLWVCVTCHDWIHNHPEESYEVGWMVRKGGQQGEEGYTI